MLSACTQVRISWCSIFSCLMTFVTAVNATALYPYTGGNPDELPFAEGDTLTVINRSDPDWWKVEQDGLVFIVPAGYVELVEG
jgi:hypothetical protein